MKVTSGLKKGTILFTKDDLSVRPTADKIKQSIFNSIQFEIEGREVLDLFSGTGALGIEALSRSADFCTFVDKDTLTTEKNIKKVSFSEKSSIVKSDYIIFLSKTKQKYSLVFLDPPYKNGYIDKALLVMDENNLLTHDAIIILECDVSETVIIPPSYKIRKESVYGRVRIYILSRKEDGQYENSNISGQL